MRVLAALSGGVDSAVAAARACDAGHDVTAVHMALTSNPQTSRCSSRGCCTLEDAQDARRAAALLGIPFYVWDLAEQFHDTVVADFVAEYRAGRTPNPCIRCNEFIKFRELARRGAALGFDAVCTGHYASIVAGADGPELHRGACEAKDQSYVLAVMGREALGRVLFPLGDAVTKDEVRREAAERGLPMSAKPDSYDICFIPDGDTAGFLRSRMGTQPGPILDTEGNEVGTHRGAYAYTVGQRRGLGLNRPAPDGRPRYVVRTDPRANTVIVGAAELLSVNRIDAADAVLLADAAHPGLSAEREVAIQVSAHGSLTPALVRIRGDEMRVELMQLRRAVAPGQSLVVYDGTRVLAQATISSARRE
ncbi:tRNA 2-thiouridine(34) synthase MnmA [Nanchangia anserum]|uniref:tRNA-specific 2-thiouridylase MnmA n=1 Tax=Nanchangia anserum TaxID=2692125 RepID=A0A8I0GDC4_9ACTO|nr:tRNA 2-thiouridine(34) synthase MnmA [Nanchangia anserum]MBD3689906.1 tRNA 2-thiouridine(34) synthase MnmA [Nanchangia anserum]QOX82572.1 tRNA 2-thiouridine(34) synthase MnmA [Nanchangia anserum]